MYNIGFCFYFSVSFKDFTFVCVGYFFKAFVKTKKSRNILTIFKSYKSIANSIAL